MIWLATSKAIEPVKKLILFASSIDENKLDQRVPLPENKDEIYQLSCTINEFIARIEKSILKQKQFTADVSHELRTPLTAIKGTLEVLLRKDRDALHYQQKIEHVLDQTNKITDLYNEMLVLAKLDATHSAVELQPIHLNEIVEAVLDKLEKNILDQNLEVKKLFGNDITVLGQETYLEIIISNIISNAIKYNIPYGKLEISWLVESRTLSIYNTGIGMTKEQIPNIFNRFYRVDTSRNSNIKGHGIGLSIVQKLCALLHIEISVQSTIGEGCTFFLQFT